MPGLGSASKTRKLKVAKLRPREDWGFFGPESVTWKVWTAPTALLGFQRAVVLEHFDPFLTAAVADSAGIYENPMRRLDRTLEYFLTVAIADGRTAMAAADLLMKVHEKATGTEPISDRPYSANDPESQLWIHVTGWHSVLYAYERYGPGRLSEADEDRFWADCVVAAELQTCDPAAVPASRAEVREYYAEVRGRLCTSERANEAMSYLLRTPRDAGGPVLWASSRLIAPAAIATIPRWMRRLGRFDQPRVLDLAVVLPARMGVKVMSSRRAALAVLGSVAPRTAAVYEHWTSELHPARPQTVTPAEIRPALREGADRLTGAKSELASLAG